MNARKVREVEKNLELVKEFITDLEKRDDLKTNEKIKAYYESLTATRDSIEEFLKNYYDKPEDI